jgi:hypothetical protein
VDGEGRHGGKDAQPGRDDEHSVMPDPNAGLGLTRRRRSREQRRRLERRSYGVDAGEQPDACHSANEGSAPGEALSGSVVLNQVIECRATEGDSEPGQLPVLQGVHQVQVTTGRGHLDEQEQPHGQEHGYGNGDDQPAHQTSPLCIG